LLPAFLVPLNCRYTRQWVWIRFSTSPFFRFFRNFHENLVFHIRDWVSKQCAVGCMCHFRLIASWFRLRIRIRSGYVGGAWKDEGPRSEDQRTRRVFFAFQNNRLHWNRTTFAWHSHVSREMRLFCEEMPHWDRFRHSTLCSQDFISCLSVGQAHANFYDMPAINSSANKSGPTLPGNLYNSNNFV